MDLVGLPDMVTLMTGFNIGSELKTLSDPQSYPWYKWILCQFLRATITNYLQFSNLKQQKFIPLQFWMPEVQNPTSLGLKGMICYILLPTHFSWHSLTVASTLQPLSLWSYCLLLFLQISLWLSIIRILITGFGTHLNNPGWSYLKINCKDLFSK